MDLKTAPNSRVNRFGVCVAALYYLLLVVIILFVSVFHNSPENILRNLRFLFNLRFSLVMCVLIPIALYLLGTIFGKLIHLESALKNREDRLGIYFAAAYLFLVAAVFVFTESITKPDNVGYDWIPFIMLAMPWYSFNARFLVPGLIVNAGILYLLGMLFGKLRRRIAKDRAQRSMEFKHP